MRDSSHNLSTGLLSRVFQRGYDTMQKSDQRRIGRVAPDFQRKLVQLCEGSEEISLFLRLERRADLITKIASQEAKFRAVGLPNGLPDAGKFTVAELAGIGRHGAVSLNKNQEPNTAAPFLENAAACIVGSLLIAAPFALWLLGYPK